MFKVKRIVLLLLLALFTVMNGVWAQSFVENYRPLQSSGEFPADFRTMLSQKDDSEDYNFYMSALIEEGRLLYGTPLNEYVDRVADNLLQANQQLRSQLRFYIVKSPAVNAYSLKNGIILVNEGLLAQVSNEAELAFVIGHEVAHFAEQHSLKIGKYKYKGTGKDQMQYYLDYRSRSREQEAEADRIAVERYFAASSYSYKALDGVFDVLLYSDLPFDEIAFDRSQVETSFYQFPENYFLKQVAPIANRSETIDTLYSHPNIEKRRSLVQMLVTGKSDNGRSLYVQSEEAFKNMRDLARMECVYYWLSVHQYDQALYNAYVMQQTMPDNAFLYKAMTTAYYGMMVHKREGAVNEVIHRYKELEGEMQQVSYFLSKMSRFELSLLTLRYAWKGHEKYPNEPYYTDLLKESMQDVFVKSKKKYTDFSDYPMGYVPDSTTMIKESQQTQTNVQSGGKYDKIKQKGQGNDMVIPTSKFRTPNYMLVDIHRDSTFIALMNAVLLEEENKQILNAIGSKKEEVKKMLFMEPYCVLKTQSYSSQNEMKEEKMQHQLTKTLVTSAKRLKIEPLFYDTKSIEKFDTKQYNDYSIIRQWYRECGYAEGAQMKYLVSEDIKRVFSELGCDKLCLVAASREPGGFFTAGKVFDLVLSMSCPYVIPFAVANFVVPRYNTRVNMMIVDIPTGKQEHIESQVYSGSMSQAYRNAAVYDELYNYVKERK